MTDSLVPSYTIAYKNQSTFMKILGTILFFNKGFMTTYTTTIGSTIYFPTQASAANFPVSTKVLICHELVHVKDAQKMTKVLFGFLYMLPQILALLSIPMFFIQPWLGLVWLLMFLSPVPAYFRMKFELKAYTFSIYAMYRLNQINNYGIKLDEQIAFFATQFNTSAYYFMWPFAGPEQHLKDALAGFQAGKRPFYPGEYYDMVDSLIATDIKY